MNFVEKIKGALSDPKNTLKSIAEEPMIEEAVVIVGVYAVLASVAAYIQSYKITYVFEGFDNMPSSMQSLMTISAIVAALIVPFIIWFIVAGVIHLLSLASGGDGRFYPQVVTIAGFSMLPMIFNGIISIGLFSMIEPQTIIISQSNPAAINEITSNPSFIVSEIASIILQIWSTVIFYFGIRSAHKLSSNSSAIIAAVPLLFSVISLIWTFRGIGIL